MKPFSVRMLAVVMLGLAMTAVRADEEPSALEQEKSQKRAAIVEQLATASQLIAFGKGDHNQASGLANFQSPEALVAAAGILLRIQQEAGGFDTVDEKGEVDPSGKGAKLGEQARALIQEARNLVKGNKARTAEINEFIAQAERIEKGRGAVGRPLTITVTLAPKSSKTLSIGFVPKCEACVCYTTVGGMRQRCEILGPNGKTLYDNTGREGSHSWTTAGDSNKRMISIRLTNVGVAPHTVTVTTN